MDTTTTLNDIVALCKRRGFVFPSSDIYGGLSSSWDYGPLGVELKRQLQEWWWECMTQQHREIVGIDAAIMMHPRVWEASGHVKSFSDLMSEDTVTNERYRWDMLTEEQRQSHISPNGNPLSEPREFNLMFKTHLGPVANDHSQVYLRPETAQGIYVNYKNVTQSTRLPFPFGIAQVGKAFRNEIVTKQFIFRTCEFEQLEMQYFVEPECADEWFAHWKEARMDYYHMIGIDPERLRFQPHAPDELAHYARAAVDIQYHFPFGWQELEGVHNRGDYDLTQHSTHSGKELTHRTVEGEVFTPYIIETSAGLTRSVLMALCDAYTVESTASAGAAAGTGGGGSDAAGGKAGAAGGKASGDQRTVLRFHPRIAPITVAVFPLVKKDGLAEMAQRIEEGLRGRFRTFYDQSGAVGRRYRRQDEIGTPFCVTVDYDSKDGRGVTIRNRDTMQQERVSTDQLEGRIAEAIAGWDHPVITA